MRSHRCTCGWRRWRGRRVRKGSRPTASRSASSPSDLCPRRRWSSGRAAAPSLLVGGRIGAAGGARLEQSGRLLDLGLEELLVRKLTPVLGGHDLVRQTIEGVAGDGSILLATKD